MIPGIENVDLVSIVQQTGTSLKQQGNKHIGLCPLHEEKTPSFTVYPDNKYKCFGCGEYGDPINFVRKFYNISFLEALKYLQLENSQSETPIEIKKKNRKKRLVEKFRDWEKRYFDELGLLIRSHYKTIYHRPETVDSDFYTALHIYEYRFDILIHGTDAEKIALFKSVGDTDHQISFGGFI